MTADDQKRISGEAAAQLVEAGMVVGLGTGVNAAPVHGSGAARVVPPSECGHVNMPVRSEEDLALLRFIEARLAMRGEVAHCGVEEVLAGRGLANLHAFAAAEAGVTQEQSSAQVLAALAEGRPIREVAAEMTDLDEQRIAKLLDPAALTKGGVRQRGSGD